MGLTESTLKNLEDEAFDELFKKKEGRWKKVAKQTQAFARYIHTGDKEPRPEETRAVRISGGTAAIGLWLFIVTLMLRNISTQLGKVHEALMAIAQELAK